MSIAPIPSPQGALTFLSHPDAIQECGWGQDRWLPALQPVDESVPAKVLLEPGEPLLSFSRIQRALGGAVSSHPHTFTLCWALAPPPHPRPQCASTLFLQGACELVPESLPGTQEGSSSL